MPTFASTAKLLCRRCPDQLHLRSAQRWSRWPQQEGRPTGFSSGAAGWLTFNVDFSIVPAEPVRSATIHSSARQQSGGRRDRQAADLFHRRSRQHTGLKPWVMERMKKDNAEVLAGKIAFTPHSACWPAGVPGFHLYGFQPLYFVQTPKQVVMIYSNDQQVRRVYLDVPHSANLKPTWYGESVRPTTKATRSCRYHRIKRQDFVNNFRTPHTDKLHGVERFKLVDGGKAMQVDITFEDSGCVQRAVVGDAALRSYSATHGGGNLRREQRASVRLSHAGGRQGGFLKRSFGRR